MTFISRKSRIIVSRYLDGRESEKAITLCRKRSEGRLKRFTSCDDLRAWINNNCIKYEHFLDLMSDGETKRHCGRLYGRFVPVPFLIKLFQKQQSTKRASEGKPEKLEEEGKANPLAGGTLRAEEDEPDDSMAEANGSAFEPKKRMLELTDSITDPNEYENWLKEYSKLLGRAVSKLEAIDRIVYCANAEFESARQEEIQEMFKFSRELCCCSNKSKQSISPASPTKSSVRKFRGSAQSSALLKKISGLQEELRRIQAISDRLENAEPNPCEPSSFPQVKELYNRKQQENFKRPRKKFEKLLAKKGKILTEICDDLRNLNNLKKASRSSLSFRRKNFDDPSKKTHGDVESLGTCPCNGSFNYVYPDNIETLDTRYGFSATSSTDLSLIDDCLRNSKPFLPTSNDYRFNSSQFFNNCGTYETPIETAEPLFEADMQDPLNDILNYSSTTEINGVNDKKHFEKRSSKKDDELSNHSPITKTHPKKYKQRSKNSSQADSSLLEDGTNPNVLSAKKSEKIKKKEINCMDNSKPKKADSRESPKRRSYIDNLEMFQNSFTSKNQEISGNKTVTRPQTAPKTTKRDSLCSEKIKNYETLEKFRKSESSITNDGAESSKTSDLNKLLENRPQRKIKSETTMKEIEKALRNYEQRLACVDSLDYKVEEMKQKLWESCRYKKQMATERAKTKKLQAVERQRSNKKMMNLCSENLELKKKIEELTAKCESQCEKIANLKYSANRARELECETEMLKKELSEYQENMDYQRKCITDWENIVAVQRTEIENLENQIKSLTTCRESNNEKKNPQRSRSYSPEAPKLRTPPCRPKHQTRRTKMSTDEDVICCYDPYKLNELNLDVNHEIVVCDQGCCPQAQNIQWYY